MKDFDDHIADQLDQEGQFPNRSRNWRHLSKRLDAVDLGGLNARPRLRLWQAVAAVAAVSSGLLLCVVFGQKQENAALRKEIAQLRETYLPTPVRQTTPRTPSIIVELLLRVKMLARRLAKILICGGMDIGG